MQLPEVTLSKTELHHGAKRLQEVGVRFIKWNRTGTHADKTLYMDRGGTALYYAPSSKPLAERLIPFKSIVSIRSEVVETAGGVPGSRLAQVIIETTNTRKPFTFHMTEDNGLLTAQVVSRKVKYLSNALAASAFQRRIREVWLIGDKDGSGRINLPELSELLKRLNVKLSKKEVEETFKREDVDGNDTLEYHEFVALFTSLTTIHYLDNVFERYCTTTSSPKESEDEDDGGGMTKSHSGCLMLVEGIKRFFAELQGESISAEAAEAMITAYSGRHRIRGGRSHPGSMMLQASSSLTFGTGVTTLASPASPPLSAHPFGLTIHEFSMYMVDTVRNSWFDAEHDRVYMAMNLPLHHYYIACSHNTYSSGSQFTSKSKTEMYHRVLRQGCRCVEIDCHNGSSQPMVFHHYTPTSEISLIDVLKAIKESAFITSPYPVVLSLEVHTNDHQTGMIAQFLRDVFGDALLAPHEVTADPRCFTPEGLKHRVLVKWKGTSHVDSNNSTQSSGGGGHGGDGGEDGEDGTGPVSPDIATASGVKRKEGVKALRDLVTVAGVHSADGLDRNLGDIQSTSEGNIQKMVGNELQLKNTRMMTRGYPSGSRMMDSSNMDPILQWAQGVQMAAMNYQTWDEPMHIHEGFFRNNGRCGYILKPESLRTSEGVAAVWERRVPKQKMILTVHVLFGFELYEISDEGSVNPQVEVSLKECLQVRPQNSSLTAAAASLNNTNTVDPLAETIREGGKQVHTSHRTCTTTQTSRSVKGDGFMPYWNEAFEFEVFDAEHAMLLITVQDDGVVKRTICLSAIALPSLALGYRAVPMRTPLGVSLPGSTIVCNFSLRSYP